MRSGQVQDEIGEPGRGSSEPPASALGSYVTAAAMLLDLDIHPDWRGSILSHFEAIAAASAAVEGFPLDDEAESAIIFQA